jgi:DNA mismatch repair protein MutS2
MLHPQNFETKIGFDTIRSILKEYCLSSAGIRTIEAMAFSHVPADVHSRLGKAAEMKAIILMEQGFPSGNFIDLSELLRHIQPEGSSLLEEELPEVKSSLQTLVEIAAFFTEERRLKYPLLAHLGSGLHDVSPLLRRLGLIIDDRGLIRDQASTELARIRQQAMRLQAQSREKLMALLSTARRSGWTPSDMDITVRNGRLVIPVFASHKRKIRGFVHDASATEQTVFLEPEEVLDINNEVKELQSLELEEIRRILRQFTAELRPILPALLESYGIMGDFDALLALARFAIETDCVLPVLGEKPTFSWLDARHPLLHRLLKAQGKKVIPFNLELGGKNQIMVISGPNAGGKSVCLKSIGLIQYMLQCGMLVPLRETSETGIFSKVFIDIGDEQSIENDLSTYSSHLLNMLFFIRNSDEKTLFLIDELGTGTEPQAGAAIAETCLELLHEKRAVGAVTTHYANLKLLADRKPGIFNAAMMFDTRELKPLYQLVTGRPGTSFAFEIAGKIGFPKELIDLAISKAGHSQYDFEMQLQQLEQDRLEIRRKETEFKVADAFLAELIVKYERLNESLESKKHDVMRKAKAEALKLIQDSNKLIENTIREIREGEAGKVKTRELRKVLSEKRAELGEEPLSGTENGAQPATPRRKLNVLAGPVNVGDQVRIRGQKAIAKVLTIKGTQAEIIGGSISMKVSLNQLEKIEILDDAGSSANNPTLQRIADDIRRKLDTFTPFIDIRGMRAEEARLRMESFLDEAILLNIHELRVLHGKGDGVLRQVTRDYLSSRSEISQFRDEHADRGGHGITIIRISS